MRKNKAIRSKILIMLSCIIALPFASQAQIDLKTLPLDLTLSHSEGRGVGFDDGYTSLEAFVVAPYRNFIRFLDIRGHVFNHGKPAANIGIGFRNINPCNSSIYGFNLYYDYRQGIRRGAHQVGIGFEKLGPKWDARINGYYVLTNKHQKKNSEFFDYPGGYFAEFHEVDKQASGVDAEIGCNVYRNCFWNYNFSLYAAIGPYFFKTENPHNALGGRIRLLASLGNWLTLEIRNTYDRVFRDRVQGILSLNIPFGCLPWECSQNSDQVAIQPVVRNDMIVFGRDYEWRANF